MSRQVEEKNNRIQEILVDLGSDETFFRPKWLDVEQPEEVFNVRYNCQHLKYSFACFLDGSMVPQQNAMLSMVDSTAPELPFSE